MEELIETLIEALSPCSELLNGIDQTRDAIFNPEGIPNKSFLTLRVDEAIGKWRKWKFR